MKDQIRGLFLLLFALSIVSIPVFLILVPETYLHSASLHGAIFFISLYYLWDKDLRTSLKAIGFPGSLKNTVIYTIAGLAAFFVLLFSLAFVSLFFGFADQQNVADTVMELPFYLLVFAIIFAPISEELFFRALLVSRTTSFLSSRTPPLVSYWSGIIFPSILFGFLHFGYGSVVEIAGATMLGAVLAIVYRQSKSITPCLLMHFIYNLVSIYVMTVMQVAA